MEQVTFTVHLYANHGVAAVLVGRGAASSRRMIATRNLPDVEVGSTPNAVLEALYRALKGDPV